jgi:hypothetical protein
MRRAVRAQRKSESVLAKASSSAQISSTVVSHEPLHGRTVKFEIADDGRILRPLCCMVAGGVWALAHPRYLENRGVT